ncbi:MAG: hypothetical protein RJB60_205, partial [Pseudomonadota bacterium]
MTHLSRSRALKRHAIQAACLSALGAFALPGAWAQSKAGVQFITVSTSSAETIVRVVVPDPFL